MEILDPTLFPSEEDFEQHRRATPGLSRLVESLSHRVFPVPGQDEEETAQTVEQVESRLPSGWKWTPERYGTACLPVKMNCRKLPIGWPTSIASVKC